MATLYLHIGMPKTGTTAIQHFCVSNVETLARLGYCYPRTREKLPKSRVDYERNGWFMCALSLREDGSFERHEDEANWRRCMDYVTGKFRHYHTVILSEETIWFRDNSHTAGLWKILKREAEERGFDIRFIVYLRRQDQFITSQWKQNVKRASSDLGICRSEEMLERTADWFVLDYFAQLERIASVFGRESIYVRIYDRDRFADGDIVSDFLKVVGIPADLNFKRLGERNPSLKGNMIEIMRIVNLTPDIDSEMRLRARRAALACSGAEEEFSIFTDEELRMYLDRYEESNRCLARYYFGMSGGGGFSLFTSRAATAKVESEQLANIRIHYALHHHGNIHAEARQPSEGRLSLRSQVAGTNAQDDEPVVDRARHATGKVGKTFQRLRVEEPTQPDKTPNCENRTFALV